jgi:hypothetical protein
MPDEQQHQRETKRDPDDMPLQAISFPESGTRRGDLFPSNAPKSVRCRTHFATVCRSLLWNKRHFFTHFPKFRTGFDDPETADHAAGYG